jgi:hypothetical protein
MMAVMLLAVIFLTMLLLSILPLSVLLLAVMLLAVSAVGSDDAGKLLLAARLMVTQHPTAQRDSC